MEGYLRIGLLVLAAVIVFFMLYESRSRRRPVKVIESNKNPTLPVVDEDWNLGHDRNAIFQRTDPELSFFQDSHLEDVPMNPEPLLIEPEVVESEHPEAAHAESTEDLLVLSVFAKPGQHFASYDLLQAISAAGMQYGEMKIFHYYLPTLTGKFTLFSLASATEPGNFDMDRIGELSCKGLTLFMNMRSVPDPEQAFDLMLRTAEQLSDDLDGEMHAWPKHPWNDEMLKHYRTKIANYQSKYH